MSGSTVEYDLTSDTPSSSWNVPPSTALCGGITAILGFTPRMSQSTPVHGLMHRHLPMLHTPLGGLLVLPHALSGHTA